MSPCPAGGDGAAHVDTQSRPGPCGALQPWSAARPGIFHYRTKDKMEVDLVLEDAQRRVVGIEVKAFSTARGEDFRGLRHLAARLGGDFLGGIVLYTGRSTLSFGPNLKAAPISAVWTAG
jgi:predicted AAA+ superfamily ATPase